MTNVTLSDSVYDKLKKMTQVGFPALGSLYFGLAQIWDLPAGEEVVGSIALVTTFFGVVLGVSSKNYNAANNSTDGEILIMHPEPGKKRYSLDLDGNPDDISHGDVIKFKVVDQDEEMWHDRPLEVPPNAE